jgi:hypothetical protein
MPFADRTGLTSRLEPRRYLWTDAFAVATFLELGEWIDQSELRELPRRLIAQVHHTLARHRPDSGRAGWLSGLSESEGELHPTRGGLRIGKPLPERSSLEPFDERLEWDRDGQYLHYLTKWMHALDQAARALDEPHFNLWGRELAELACKAFAIQLPTGGWRLAWKMSIDLSRPLVGSSGQHDALDAFVTCAELRATAFAQHDEPRGPLLDTERRSLWAMLHPKQWWTSDPLGLGGVLSEACRVEQLVLADQLPEDDLLSRLLAVALNGLREYVGHADLREPAARRLAFRELGLAIGLSAVELIERELGQHSRRFAGSSDVRALLRALERYVPLGSMLQKFWLDPAQQRAPIFGEHRDINEVMLAASLIPEGWLLLRAQ